MKGMLDVIASADDATLDRIQGAVNNQRRVNEFEAVSQKNKVLYGMKELQLIYQKHVPKTMEQFDTAHVRFKGNSYEWDAYYYDHGGVYIHISARPQPNWHDKTKHAVASIRGKHFNYYM